MVQHKFLINGQLKYAVLGIFGETAVEMLNQLKEQEQELDEDAADEIATNGTEMFRFFETVPEANAYAQGIIDMCGNNDYAFLTQEEHKALFQQLTPAQYLGEVESEKKEAEEAMYDPARGELTDKQIESLAVQAYINEYGKEPNRFGHTELCLQRWIKGFKAGQSN